MTYRVKEIFYTLQGEGTHAGRPAVFCRFTSCNLWTGREKDRRRAICQFCDTDFVGTDGPGGGRFATAADLAAAVVPRGSSAAHARARPVRRVHRRGTSAATRPGRCRGAARRGVRGGRRDQRDSGTPRRAWTGCASARRRARRCSCQRRRAQARLPAGRSATRNRSRAWTSRACCCSRWTARSARRTLACAVEYCLAHPQWQLSLQTHKYLGIA